MHTGNVPAAWVSVLQRTIHDVGVGIQTRQKSDWIAFSVSSDIWVVVPKVVVVKVYFPVRVLPRKPHRELECAESRGIFIRHGDPEGLLLVPSPDRLLILIGDEPWRVEMVDVSGCLVPPLLPLAYECSNNPSNYENHGGNSVDKLRWMGFFKMGYADKSRTHNENQHQYPYDKTHQRERIYEKGEN